ncbi:Calcium-dependent lipid-binding (CaLB domain) family protein [Euphorbia peplus]|nr:Calcium-dependent lipid-binding (CaLB domain) family protein [Euphorbia peplus]
MGKIWIEVCLISARGLRRTSSFWKLQWFAVGWIHPDNRYCTKIDASANANPTWNTKFATLVDDSNFQDMALHVEVYSREPLFLRERLHGNAIIVLKEFVAKYSSSSEASRDGTQVGSYQLRNRSSSKPQGFIDVSIRISEDRGHPSSSFTGNEGEFVLMGHNNNTTLSSGGTFPQAYPSEQPLGPPRRPTNFDHSHPMPYQSDHSNPSAAGPSYHPPAARPSYNPPPAAGPSYPSGAGQSYHPPQATGPSYHPSHAPPPPPPPPSNVGYVPTFLPNTDYINMPASAAAAPRRGVNPALVGVGAGALAAGAVIFGDDFMSGFNVPTSLPDPTLAISIDPPF